MTQGALQDTKLIEEKMQFLVHHLKDKQNMDVLAGLDEESMQDMLSILINIYAAKIKVKGDTIKPVHPDMLGQTETTVFVDQLLKSMDVELFEMQIWRSMGSNY